MDYFSYNGKFRGFVFDLQRFGEDSIEPNVTVDLTSVKEVLGTGTRYLVGETWVSNLPEDPATVKATLAGGTLSVVVNGADKNIWLKGVTAAELFAAGITLTATNNSAMTSANYYLSDSEGNIDSNQKVTGSELKFINGYYKEISDLNGIATLTMNGNKGVYTFNGTKTGTITTYYGWSKDVCEKLTVGAPDVNGVAVITMQGDEAGVYSLKLADAQIKCDWSLESEAEPTTAWAKNTGETYDEVVPAAFSTTSGSLTLPVDTVLSITGQKGEAYYAVTVGTDGTLKVDNEIATADVTGAIGYLKVEYNKDYAQKPSATVSFVSNRSGSKSILLTNGPLSIDASALQTGIGGVAVATVTIDSSIKSSNGTVDITGVPTSADVIVGAATYTSNLAASAEGNTSKNAITYKESFVLSATGNTIDLSTLNGLTDGQSRYFEITAKNSDHGKVEYSIGAPVEARTTALAANGAFKVTYASTETTFTVEYVAATGEGKPANLNAEAWSRIQINADNLSAGKTLNIKSVGTETDDATHDNYTVNNAANGLVVTLTKDTAGGKYDDSKMVVNRASASTEATFTYPSLAGITLPTGNTTEYWSVGTPDIEGQNTGIPTIAITSAGTTEPASTTSYIAVTKAGNAYTPARPG